VADRDPGLPVACAEPGVVELTGSWRHPVEAAVADWFRPPSHPYGPGNRGLEYATDGGETVGAVDDGVVVFAGPVGRSRFVVVDHGNGLVSTAAFLRRVDTSVGDPVEVGQPIAEAAPGFHLTARQDGDYVDPMTFMGGLCVSVSLVPVPAGPHP
jgi:septal ring factor EnvC (AmiA/AmiB activator)